MSERLVNIFAAVASVGLIAMFLAYTFQGRLYDINFVFIPLLIIGITYTMLALHQSGVARSEDFHPFLHPVPFRWVLAIKYLSFAVLIWWVLADIAWDMPLEPGLRRLIWLQSALVHVWFLRRFVVWDRPSVQEASRAREKRQDETDVRQDARDVVQDERERQQGGSA